MAKKTAVISAGAWGTAIAKILAENGNSVEIWDHMEDVVNDINNNHQNSRYLPGIDLPPDIKADSDICKVAEGRDCLILATPSLYILDIVRKLVSVPSIMEGTTQLAVLAKGFLPSESGPRLIIETIEQYLPGFYQNRVVYISGPSHAEEVSRGKITGLISACTYARNAILFREILQNESLLVFSSLDIKGVQTAAAVKNVIAIAFGMMDALLDSSSKLGDNTESLLLAAGLNEIMSIGLAMGATHPETFTSIAGVGDLDVTCRSRHGRNRRFGKEIIEKNILQAFDSLDDLIEHIDKVGYLPEGAVAARYIRSISEKHKLKLPVCNTVFKVLNREYEASKATEEMLGIISGAAFAPRKTE